MFKRTINEGDYGNSVNFLTASEDNYEIDLLNTLINKVVLSDDGI